MRPAWPALRPSLPRVPARRVALVAGGALVGIVFAYLVARETPLFAIRSVQIAGVDAQARPQVTEALRSFEGTSLVKIDPGAVEARLRTLPSVLDAKVDRAFPNTLRVAVEPEQPLAVLRYRTDGWLVSRRGRVIRPFDPSGDARLPRIWTAAAADLTAGDHVSDANAQVVLRALDDVPERFPLRILAGRTGDDGVTFILSSGTELRLGTPDDLRVKLAAAQAVLRALSAARRAELGYLDVSLPERPVVADKSQLVR
ncbi:MAG TPA: FtsQ-type POTRA domain-containing protein [Gaiellaceae bacterium]